MIETVNKVIDAYGGVPGVQERFEYKHPMAVYNWRTRGLPKSKVPEIHIDTGIELSRLMSAAEPRGA